MNSFADPSDPAGKVEALASLRTHWQELRGARLLPRRGEIVAREIDAALPWLFTAEPVAPGVLRIRHAGRRLSDMLRMEPRGMPLCAFLAPEGRASLRPLVTAAQLRPAVVEAGLVAGSGIVIPAVPARLLLLPLSDQGLRPDCFVGVLAAGQPVPRRPLRFDLAEGTVRITPLRSEAAMPRLVASGGTRNADPGMRPALRLVSVNG